MLCMSASVHFVSMIDVRLQRIGDATFGASPLRSHDRIAPGAGVVERDVEVGEPDEPAR